MCVYMYIICLYLKSFARLNSFIALIVIFLKPSTERAFLQQCNIELRSCHPHWTHLYGNLPTLCRVLSPKSNFPLSETHKYLTSNALMKNVQIPRCNMLYIVYTLEYNYSETLCLRHVFFE